MSDRPDLDPTPILRIAHVPPPTVSSGTTVRDAVRLMTERRVGAVAVVDDARLVGIFTERDLMTKVVQVGLPPDTTAIRDVMVRDPLSLPPTAPRSVALEKMVQGHFRHMPIVDEKRRVLGMLSIRNLLHERLESLKLQMDSLEAYMSADGPGG